MSRSFGKKAQGCPMWRGWHKFMRARERLMIHREMTSEVHGDVVFPIVKEVSNPRDGDNYSDALYRYKKATRDNYFTEIRNILNGYQKWWYWKYREQNNERPLEDYQKSFIESFERIKIGKSPDREKMSRYERQPLCFEWLHNREVKEAIKKWDGDPLDILHYLTSSGIIEKAVREDYKRMSRK